MDNKQQLKVNKYESFNGIRGLAAVVVFFSHAVGMFYTGNLNFILWDGATAVNIFFIMSGFFLSLKHVTGNKEPIQIVPYLIKRFFRLYPAFIVGMIFAIILQFFFFQPDSLNQLSDWIASKWVSPPNTNDIVNYIAVRGASVDSINSTMWAMSVFIYISLFFPLVIIPLQKINSVLGSLTLFIISCIAHLFVPFLKFLPIFVIGAILAKYHKEFYDFLNKALNSFTRPVLFALSLFLINIRFFMPLLFGIVVPDHGLTIDPIMSIGWILLLYFVYHKDLFSTLLTHKYVLFLGKISYSFYIVHFPIMLVVTSIVYPLTNSLTLSIGLSLVLTIVTAHLFNTLVEIPFKNIGYSLSNKYEKSVFKEAL